MSDNQLLSYLGELQVLLMEGQTQAALQLVEAIRGQILSSEIRVGVSDALKFTESFK